MGLKLFFCCLLILSSCDPKLDYIQIYSPCKSDESFSKTSGTKENDFSIISSLEDLWFDSHFKYKFTIELDKEFEFCGYQPHYFCSVGEPDNYLIIDSTLNQDIWLFVEVSIKDQKKYDLFFPDKREKFLDSIAIIYGETNSISFEEDMGFSSIKYYDNIKFNKNGVFYFGSGYEAFTKEGVRMSEFKIHGKEKGIIVGLTSRIYGNPKQLNTNKLFCIIENLQLEKI